MDMDRVDNKSETGEVPVGGSVSPLEKVAAVFIFLTGLLWFIESALTRY